MRPEKLYAAGSRYRRAGSWRQSPSPTVIVQLSPDEIKQAVQRPSIRRRLWTFAKAVGPVFIAVAALLISFFSYQDQHTADQQQQQAGAAAEALRVQEQAELISFWQTGGLTASWSLAVENRSDDPILAVFVVAVGNVEYTGPPQAPPYGLVLFFTLAVPPCSIGIAHPSRVATEDLKDNPQVTKSRLSSESSTFLAVKMVYYTPNGVFENIGLGASSAELSQTQASRFDKLSNLTSFSLPATFKPSDGCS